MLTRLPFFAALCREFGLVQMHFKQANFFGIKRDDVAVLDQRNRTAHCGFGPDMTRTRQKPRVAPEKAARR